MSQDLARVLAILALCLAMPGFAQFTTPSPGAAIEQAARANRPSANPIPPAKHAAPDSASSVQVLTDTKGVSVQPYLDTMLPVVRDEWYAAIHEVVKKPDYRRGTVVAEFVITRAGEIENPRITESSGEDDLDKAVTEALVKANPLPAIPKALPPDQLHIRFKFMYLGKKGRHGLPQ